jgi:hypothetical protein
MASTYWQAGWKLTAARLNSWTDRVRPQMQEGALSGDRTNLNGSFSDLAGTTLTFTTTTNNATYEVFTAWDYEPGSLLVGNVNVDGSRPSGEAHSTGERQTVHMCWKGTLGAAGTHTFKLQAWVTGAAGTLFGSHTKLIVNVYEAA